MKFQIHVTQFIYKMEDFMIKLGEGLKKYKTKMNGG
jgi:hypothetical protein